MRRLLLIGIGAGDPEHVTVQAVGALNRAEVFFVVARGAEVGELSRARAEICARFVTRPHYRIVELADPPRDRTADAYRAAVQDWRRRRADVWERAIASELGDDGCGAFLIWGDPSLYDSTLAIVQEILARGRLSFEYEVIPGISSLHALTAAHRVSLSRVAGAVQITTGRRLAEGLPAGADDVAVMLDGDCAFRHHVDEDLEIYWGAYVGTEDEILRSGPLAEVAGEIQRVRREARERKGWVMDAYLLRRRS